MRTVLSFILIAQIGAGQSMRTGEFHGRKAYILENKLLRITLLRGGGHIAGVSLISSDAREGINPMRVPHYATIEPYEYEDAKHNAIYGADPHRWLSSGYMGHLLCFPAFGPPSSAEEIKADLGNHGEAPIVEWKPIGAPIERDSAITFRYGADLPKTQFHVDRTVTLAANESVAYIEEWVENLASYDRPVNWVQHATMGPPFAVPGKNYLDLSATKGQVAGGAPATSSLKPDSHFTWPDGESIEGARVSLRPFQTNPSAGGYFAVLMDQQRAVNYFTLYNTDYRVLIGYLFRTADSPWLGDFQENGRIKTKPWNGEAVTRGIEFGSTPFAEGLKRSIARGSMFGVPTFRWIGAKQRVKWTYVLFLAKIPAGFAGTADVTTADGRIVIAERGTQRTITLPASRLSLLTAP